MVKNFFKKIGAGIICIIMLMEVSVPAFATTMKQDNYEVPANKELVIAEYTFSTDTNSIESTQSDSYDNDPVAGDIGALKTGYIYPKLSSYVGLYKGFQVFTSSSLSGGGIFLYLYNEKGKLISKDWSMGVNDHASWSLFLPSSGTYTLKIVNTSDASVHVAAFWEG